MRDTDITFHPETHQYFRGLQELTSVTRVIKSVWPVKPDYDAAHPDVLENARQRGVELDGLFALWMRGELAEIPEGTRQDVSDLMDGLTSWWHTQDFGLTETQVVLGDHEIAGCLDLMGHRTVWDLKTTYNLEPTYALQVGGYCHLYQSTFGELPESAGIIHVTKRFKQPKLVEYDVQKIVSEFRVLLDFWRLAKRMTKGKL